MLGTVASNLVNLSFHGRTKPPTLGGLRENYYQAAS